MCQFLSTMSWNYCMFPGKNFKSPDSRSEKSQDFRNNFDFVLKQCLLELLPPVFPEGWLSLGHISI